MKYFYIETIGLLISLVTLSKGIQWFSREPPSKLYVSSGGTARLVWDYNVRNRTAMFDPYSPEWALYNTSGIRILIGVEDGYNGRKFVISKQCPPQLRGRVSKESTATLVISNVTKADERLYECSLLLLAGSPIRSKVQLVVTERPRFTTPVNLSTPINEGSSLCIRCSAAADPMPNVTWVRIIKNPTFISDGFGEAFLRFTNITRHQRGTYECHATNNPNEDPVTTRTEISVKYPVEPANVFVSDIKATSAVIKWHNPVDDGGSPVIEYKVQINTIPPREVITETTYCVTNDLNENTTYDVKVYARNAVGYGKAVCTEFTTKEPKRKAVKEMILNEETDDIVRSPVASIYAGVIGVIIWIGLISMAILVVFIKKIWVKKGKEQRQVRIKLKKRFPDDVSSSKPTDACKPDMSINAESDVSKKNDNQQPQAMLVYAQVDKSKKRRPGEIVYAELDELKVKEDASNLVQNDLPPIHHKTQYADINHCASTCHTEEAYETIYCNVD